MSNTDTEQDGHITLPGDWEAETLGHRISTTYRAASSALVHNDQMSWPVAHDALGSFYDRAEHRAIMEHLTELANKLQRPTRDVFQVLAYDGHGTIAVIPNAPYEHDRHPWPRLIITNPDSYDIQLLTAQILEDIEYGGHGDLCLREAYEEAELEAEIEGLWTMMDLVERLDFLDRHDGDALDAFSDGVPEDWNVVSALKQCVYSYC